MSDEAKRKAWECIASHLVFPNRLKRKGLFNRIVKEGLSSDCPLVSVERVSDILLHAEGNNEKEVASCLSRNSLNASDVLTLYFIAKKYGELSSQSNVGRKRGQGRNAEVEKLFDYFWCEWKELDPAIKNDDFAIKKIEEHKLTCDVAYFIKQLYTRGPRF